MKCNHLERVSSLHFSSLPLCPLVEFCSCFIYRSYRHVGNFVHSYFITLVTTVEGDSRKLARILYKMLLVATYSL